MINMERPVIVPRNRIIVGGHVPQEISSYVTQGEYSAVVTMYQQVESETQCMTCAIEWGICCCTGLWCIFCVHPCVQSMIAEQTMRQRLHGFNSMFYGGHPVLTLVGYGSISFNLALIQQFRLQPQPPVMAVAMEPNPSAMSTQHTNGNPTSATYSYNQYHPEGSSAPPHYASAIAIAPSAPVHYSAVAEVEPMEYENRKY